MTLRDKMLAVIADTNDSVAEREELVEMIAIALLTRKNLFVLGEPGQAKSYAINLFRRHITGARQFERLLSKQSDEEQLFGRVDLASLLPGSVPPTVLEQDATYQNQRFNLRVLVEGIGSMKDEPATWEKLKSGTEKLELYRAALSALHKSEPTVQTAGKIPEADIVLLDEIFKCNDGVLNSLLTALNERKYTNEGRTYPIPVISFFAASNEIPNFNDPQEKILEALYDRLELKVVTANMEDRDTRLAVLKNKQAGTFGQVTVTAVCSFSIAVDRDFKSKNGEKETDFIDIVSWRATAEFVSKYFTKGRMAVVEGRLQIRDWTDKEGGKRRSAEVIADNVYFGDSKPKDGGEEDDIPAYTGAPDSFAVPDGFTPDFGGESGEMPF